MHILRPVLALVLVSLAPRLTQGAEPPLVVDLVLSGGTLVDGTGAPARRADVALRGDRIVAVGEFAVAPGTRRIDVSGLVVAPGFIDLHTHSDDAMVNPKNRTNLNYLRQGVTTVVTGNCGSGPVDVAGYFRTVEQLHTTTNLVHLLPHGSLRASVMGNAPRAPSAAELERMTGLVDAAMKAGAWGMSTGLIYLPGRYSQTDELIALGRTVARHGGMYASHIRDEGAGLLAAIDEALSIGKGAGLPVHVSHLKAQGRANWGLTTDACRRIIEARAAGQSVTADQYPYVASSTQLAAMVVPDWAVREGVEGFRKILSEPSRRDALQREIQAQLDRRDRGAAIRIARFRHRPDWVGLDLVAIARKEKLTPLDVVIEIQRQGGAQAINFGMSEDDVRQVMAHPFVATASDGSAHQPGEGDRPHPRSYGTFPRKLRYALEYHVLSLEAAVRSCSGLPAEILRLPDRGVVRPGALADILIFDPQTFRDTATFDDPTQYATGVVHLFVNGVPVIADSQATQERPGRVLRRTSDGPPDVVYQFKKVWTGNPAQPWAEALAARDGRIVAVGSAAEVARLADSRTQLRPYPNAFAMPGLIDAHGHLADLGASLEEIDLRGVASAEAVGQRVRDWLVKHPGTGWVTGQNWDQSLWPGGAFPSAAVLDAVAPDRPVWLLRVDGHAGWANSAAMRAAGVTSQSVSPGDGQIIRSPEGSPSGVFIDGAKDLVAHALPKPSRDDFARQLLAGQSLALQAGLTGVHDAGVLPAAVDAYRELDRQGKLKLRVYGMALLPPGDDRRLASAPPTQPTSESRFELRAIKVFIDGAMGSRGGLLFESYTDDPGNKGLLLCQPAHLEALTADALRNGWQVATHAIGDRANKLVLDAYAAALRAVPQARDPRLRIEHAQVVQRADVARFATLGVIASMQPTHAVDDMRWAEARLGPERVKGAYAWSWFAEERVRLAFGSDFPVEIVNPFYGLYAAVTRQDPDGSPAGGWHPEHRITLDAAISGFTSGAAYAAFAEERVGTLRPGLRADLTVVDRDPFDVGPPALLQTKVVATIIDAECVAP